MDAQEFFDEHVDEDGSVNLRDLTIKVELDQIKRIERAGAIRRLMSDKHDHDDPGLRNAIDNSSDVEIGVEMFVEAIIFGMSDAAKRFNKMVEDDAFAQRVVDERCDRELDRMGLLEEVSS